MKFLLLFIFSTLLLSSCTKILPLEGPAFEKKAVLTGLLHPDSLLSVRLTWSRPLTESSPYLPIESAQVTFFEDDKSLGIATYQRNGSYQLGLKPSVNHTYRVEVNVPEYGVLRAQDYLPELLPLTVQTGPRNPDNINSNPDLTLSFTPTPQASFWLAINHSRVRKDFPDTCYTSNGSGLKPGCKFEETVVHLYNFISTRTPVFDQFNGSVDSFGGVFMFGAMTRVLPEYAPLGTQQNIVFSMLNTAYGLRADADSREKTYLEVTAAGPAFDRYLKTAFVSQANQLTDFNGSLQNPFAEPSPAYSNVENGLGIFGARNRRSIRLQLDSTSISR